MAAGHGAAARQSGIARGCHAEVDRGEVTGGEFHGIPGPALGQPMQLPDAEPDGHRGQDHHEDEQGGMAHSGHQ
jgi:hypothetical protein